jgi:hypothetical protein
MMPDTPDRLVLVSVPKSGTHLASRLVEHLGFSLVWRLYNEVEVLEAERPGRTDTTSIPYGRCLVVHRMSADRMSPWFYKEWASGSIQVLLSVRDPRDVLVSALDYLLAKRDVALPFPGLYILMDVVRQIDGRGRQLDFLMDEVCLPMLGPLHPIAVLRDMSYLALHPSCLVVRFEDLVGPQGGGSAERQTVAIQAVLDWSNIEGDPRRLAERLFDPRVKVFNQGRVGRWREELSAAQVGRFEHRYGDVLRTYGYGRATS